MRRVLVVSESGTDEGNHSSARRYIISHASEIDDMSYFVCQTLDVQRELDLFTESSQAVPSCGVIVLP